MKQIYFKSLFLSLLMIVVGGIGAMAAEEETIASFTASDYYSGTTDGWTVNEASYATAGGGYYQLIKSDASIVTPSINWSEYSDITITISARKFGGPDATQGKISVSQGETELASYSPSGSSIAASSALAISPVDGKITISCPGASSGKGCGVQSIVIKGTPSSTPSTAVLTSLEFEGDYPTLFAVDDEFSYEGLVINAVYDDGTSKDVTSKATYTLEKGMDYEGTQMVEWEYTEGDVKVGHNYQITTVKMRLSKIEATTTKNTFYVGEEFTTEGLTVMATYVDERVVLTDKLEDREIDVTDKITVVTAPDMSTAGTFKEVKVSYTDGDRTQTAFYYINVEEAPNEYYEKVTSAPSDWSGEYLIVYEEGSVAFNGGLSTLDAAGNTIEVVMNNNKIVATNAVNAATFTIAKIEGDNTYSIKSASGNYIGVTSNSNGLKQSDTSAYAHNLSVSEGDAVIAAAFDGSSMTLRYNSASNQARFRYYRDYGQKAIQLYKKTVALDNQYTLVTVEDEGETETAFDGNSLTKELPASTKFYIKDNNGNKYYGTADDYGVATIFAENHENVTTSANGANFYLRKANTWVFTVAELETTEGITLTVNPETAGETKYMITPSEIAESEDVFDESLQLTKVMTTDGFYLMRSDDYGLFELTAAESNVSEGATQFYIWEFSEQNPTVGFLVNKRINTYRVDKAGTYTFTLDTENNTLTAEFISGKQYTLVTSDGTEYPFEGLTLTQELTGRTEFYIKDNTGKEYYATENTEDAIISAENHENLPTYESDNNFVLKKANTWVFTITELTDADGITLTVNPETAGDTKYMISQSLTEESEDVFDENLQLTKEMDTTPFYITRSDDYGIFELSAVRRTNTEGYTRFTFTEDDNTVEFVAGKRMNMYEMSEAGTYTFTINLTNNTVTAEKTTEITATGNLNSSETGVFFGAGIINGNGNDYKGMTVPGTLTTAFGDVSVVYTVGTTNGYAYINNEHIRMYAEGTTLKFTAPEGYVLSKIALTKTSGNFENLTTDAETYDDGTWEGEAESVTFTSQNATIRLSVAEVTLKKAEFVEFAITNKEWATFVTPAPVKFQSDVKAYIITSVDGSNATGEEVTEVPEGTAVIVNGAEGTHKAIKVDAADAVTNMLLVSDGTVIGDGTIYVLSVQGGQAGFAPLSNGNTLSEGKAYLKVESAGAKINLVIDGETNDIRGIENAVDFSDGAWYNLQGVKVAQPQKGIYIHNGKKVVIK